MLIVNNWLTKTITNIIRSIRCFKLLHTYIIIVEKGSLLFFSALVELIGYISLKLRKREDASFYHLQNSTEKCPYSIIIISLHLYKIELHKHSQLKLRNISSKYNFFLNLLSVLREITGFIASVVYCTYHWMYVHSACSYDLTCHSFIISYSPFANWQCCDSTV